MVDKSKKTVQARARVAHKLAKYVRANPIHLSSKLSPQAPSISHLSKHLVQCRSWWCSQKEMEKLSKNLVSS